MDWKDNALEILRASMTPVPHELSELDWKSGLSSKTDRLAQYICAFSNHQGGEECLFTVLMMTQHLPLWIKSRLSKL